MRIKIKHTYSEIDRIQILIEEMYELDIQRKLVLQTEEDKLLILYRDLAD